MYKDIQFLISLMDYSQIWLNLPMHDGHFGYITKLPKTTLSPRRSFPNSSQSLTPKSNTDAKSFDSWGESTKTSKAS